MIINSILDNDTYKLAMQQAVLAYAPGTRVKYKFHNRRPEGKFTHEFLLRLQYEIKHMSRLYLFEGEKKFLYKHCPYLSSTYINYLSHYQYFPPEVQYDIKDGELVLEISGPWEHTILWEVPLMAMISELYFKLCDTHWEDYEDLISIRIREKRHVLTGCKFADFGTRRRRSHGVHRLVVNDLIKSPGFVGTSNMLLAYINNVKPIGTMAHEWIMGVSALEGLRHANRHALRIWSEIYKGSLGIALTDTFGTDAFLADFDLYFAKLFDGVRHDSGDPIEFGEKIITHYKHLNIDPASKTIVFSDSLTPEQALLIDNHFKSRINVSFGIGTNFTNDFPGSPALNMVIKMDRCNNVPVVKLSDDEGKQVGDANALQVANWTFGRRQNDLNLV